MNTPTQTYTRIPNPLDSHLAWCENEGISVYIVENDTFVSVETTTRWGSKDLDIFRKSDGKKISSFDDMKHHLHSFIKG